MTPRNFRTFNPWGHVSKADRVARLQIAKSLSDRANGKTWKIWQRPSGDDSVDLKRTFTRYAPYQWKQCGSSAFANKEAALEFLHALVGAFGIEQVSENEYTKDAMRYIVEDEAAEQCMEPTEGTLPVISSESVGGSH